MARTDHPGQGRERLLRTLIADITLLPEPDLAKARIGIRWHTGSTDELTVARRHSIVESHRTDPAAVDLVRALGPTHTNVDLANRLNSDGYLTGAGRPFDVTAVANLRSYHRIAPVGTLGAGEITVKGPGGRWLITYNPDVEDICRARIATSGHLGRPDSKAS